MYPSVADAAKMINAHCLHTYEKRILCEPLIYTNEHRKHTHSSERTNIRTGEHVYDSAITNINSSQIVHSAWRTKFEEIESNRIDVTISRSFGAHIDMKHRNTNPLVHKTHTHTQAIARAYTQTRTHKHTHDKILRGAR